MRGFRNLSGVIAVLIGALALTAAASGHASPAGCTGSGPQVSFSDGSGLDQLRRNGEVLTIGATVSNSGSGACDITGLEVSVRLPTPEGLPGEPVEIATLPTVPAGTRTFDLGSTVPYEVDLPEAVFQAPVSLSYSFTLHSGSPDEAIDEQTKATSLSITRPTASLEVTSSIDSGPPPLTVSYTYELTNTSPPHPGTLVPAPAIVSSNLVDATDLIRDDGCQSITYVSGNRGSESPATLDPARDGVPAETWKFACTRTFGIPGNYVSSATVKGTSTADGREWPTSSPVITEVNVLGPDLTVDKSHVGDFLASGTGSYTLRVANSGNQPSSGPVTLKDLLPWGLTATSMDGPGWDCNLAALTCVRADALASGGYYPDVTLGVTVAKSPPESVINRATVQNDSQFPGTNDADDDPTRIRTPGTPGALPSNHVDVRSAKARPNGSIVLRVRVPGPGLIAADDLKRKTDLFVRTTKRSYKAGVRKLELKPTRKLRQRLAKSKQPVKASIKLSFTPKGGLTSNRRLMVAVGSG